MPTNDFLPFATTDETPNVITQADYEVLAALATGFSSGRANSAQVNKVLRQASSMGAVIAGYILAKANVDVLDNGDISGLITKLTAGIAAQIEAYGYAPLASPSLTGNPTAPTQASSDNSTKLATTAHVKSALIPYAPLASPALSGVPTAPQAARGNNTGQLANTAYVMDALTQYYTAATINSILGGYYTAAQINSIIAAYYSAAQVESRLASYQPLLGFTPARQGGGPGQGSNTVNIGWDGGGVKVSIDGSDQGRFAMMSGFTSGAGWQKLASGKMIQWGLGGMPGGWPANTPVTVSFPMSFSSSLDARFVTNANGGSSIDYVRYNAGIGASLSGFNIQADVPGQHGFYWFAIGS